MEAVTVYTHTVRLQVGDQFIATSITVLEQKTGPQFIFGLENMRRHQCIIDLPANMLRIGSCNVTLPFLPEHEVPKDFNIERQTTDVRHPAAGLSALWLPALQCGMPWQCFEAGLPCAPSNTVPLRCCMHTRAAHRAHELALPVVTGRACWLQHA